MTKGTLRLGQGLAGLFKSTGVLDGDGYLVCKCGQYFNIVFREGVGVFTLYIQRSHDLTCNTERQGYFRVGVREKGVVKVNSISTSEAMRGWPVAVTRIAGNLLGCDGARTSNLLAFRDHVLPSGALLPRPFQRARRFNEPVDIVGNELSTSDGHVTIVVLTTSADHEKARTVGDRVLIFVWAIQRSRMITVISSSEDT